MQSLFEDNARRLSRRTVGRAIRMVDNVMAANGVCRARDLPEEARVRLNQRLSAMFLAEHEAEWSRLLRPSLSQRVRMALDSLRHARR